MTSCQNLVDVPAAKYVFVTRTGSTKGLKVRKYNVIEPGVSLGDSQGSFSRAIEKLQRDTI